LNTRQNRSKQDIQRALIFYARIIEPRRFYNTLLPIQRVFNYVLYLLVIGYIPFTIAMSRFGMSRQLLTFTLIVILPILIFIERNLWQPLRGGINWLHLFYSWHQDHYLNLLKFLDIEHLPILVDLFNRTTHPAVRAIVLEAIGVIPHENAFNQLNTILTTRSDPCIRHNAVKNMAKFAYTSYAPDRLYSLFLSYPDGETRLILFQYLFSLRPITRFGITPDFLLSFMLSEDYPPLRAAIASYLRRFNDASMIPAFIHFIHNDPDLNVRCECLFTLLHIDRATGCRIANQIYATETNPAVIAGLELEFIRRQCQNNGSIANFTRDSWRTNRKGKRRLKILKKTGYRI